MNCNSSQHSNWAHKCHSSVKYEKFDDQHTTVSRCLSNENEGEEKLENLKESLNKVEETHPEN